MSSRFAEVFRNIPVPQDLAAALGEAVITNIKLSREQRRLNINMELDEVVEEHFFDSLCTMLKNEFPFMNDINVDCRLTSDKTNLREKIVGVWDNIVYRIEKKSHFCYEVLKDAQLDFEDNALIVKVKYSGSYIFVRKGIDKTIESMIEAYFGEKIWVRFEETKGAAKVRELLYKENDSLIQESISKLSFEPQEPKAAPAAEKKVFVKGSGPRAPRAPMLKINNALKGVTTLLSEELETDDTILIQGEIFSIEERTLRSGNLLIMFDITDGEGSITSKMFIDSQKYTDEYKALLKKGSFVSLLGKIIFDDYSKQVCLTPLEICKGERVVNERTDDAPVKRVELHLHTNMSQMDAINTASDYIKRAARWGHPAIAITDHGVVQAFPEAMDAAKKAGIKAIYGVEAYLIDDLEAIVSGAEAQTLDDKFVVFDIETTGLSKETDKIIEIGAVKIEGGVETGRFSALIDPKMRLPEKIKELTHITDEMLAGKELIEQVLPQFFEFMGDSVLVAHNASFDVGFITEQGARLGLQVENTVLDTLGLCRVLFPQLGRHKLNIICDHLGVSLENHHRAVDDAAATAEIFIKCSHLLKEQGINEISQINSLVKSPEDLNKLKARHAVILVKNQTGLRNLYELVSDAHIKYFYKRPRIPKSQYLKHREGLLIGTACEAGELYKAVKEKRSEEAIKALCHFYDYLEIQPIGNNMYLVRNGEVSGVEELKSINKKIVEYGEKYNKPVVATCDVHFLNKEDEVYRRIIQRGDGFKDADNQPPLYFRTTEEMLQEFSYLGQEKAYNVVVESTNYIASLTENIKPIPDETFPPKIQGAEEQIREITETKAKEIYGDPLPTIISDRLERELGSIIKNGFSVMYIIAQKLVWKSVEDGYLVGSRGSVGSSFVATMAGITEVNPMPPHYLCTSCHYSDFDSETVKAFAGASGCDMPDKDCPNCGEKLKKDGHDIPFETFLGFDGDKEPDIDLNFSGEYQAKAHAYTEELFGTGHVFKAGTIGTVADKTAYGYVKKYFEEKGVEVRDAEINRLKIGCTGIKRTTGQHPGGLMVVPDDKSIYEFCPIQRPANDVSSDVTTTHFDYHSISGRLLKLDILGHDVPTIIRMLYDITKVDPQTVDLGDKDIMSLFTSPKAMHVTEQEINCKTGTLGLPEFGTHFVRQMLLETRPETFAELVRISGMSHGTDVWINNAQDLIKEGTATLKEVIPTRDDIMVYLINKGVEKKAAFKIMENVRKGKGLKDDEVEVMKAADVPDWYIESCRRIKYMFPKGHAVAYVMMTVRIGYFKIHYPAAFYAASFSVKSEDFDYMLMCKGQDTVKAEIARINSLGKEATAKEKSIMTILELVYEMYARSLKFAPIDLYESHAYKFIVTPKQELLPPLCSVQGLGISVANNIVEARKDGEFITQEDFKERTKANKTVIELLKANGVFDKIPETNQLTLF